MLATNIYVLKLERDKYYVGRSSHTELRLIQHNTSKGSAWTSKFRPISLLEIRPCKSPFEEDMITKEYMSKYGIGNVRGGSYVKITLDSVQIDAITRELQSVSDICKSCGELGHFIKECPYTKIVPSTIVENKVWICDFCNLPFCSIISCMNHESLCTKRIQRLVPQE